jgi:hypothetical protein
MVKAISLGTSTYWPISSEIGRPLWNRGRPVAAGSGEARYWFVDALLRERAIVENALGLDVRADVREKPIMSLNAVS